MLRRRLLLPLAALLAALFAMLAAAAPAGASAGVLLMSDDFTWAAPPSWSQGGVYGAWRVEFTGYGSVGPVVDAAKGPALALTPRAAPTPAETHSALVTSTRRFGDLRYGVSLRTARQLRTGSAPNAWEVGWAIWHYSDNTHFYYVVLKPNGWEIGKEDPAYPGAQRFLATGSSPSYPVGGWHRIHVRQLGGAISLSVDGRVVRTVVDAERPYLSGSVGLYTEDAQALFTKVRVRTAR